MHFRKQVHMYEALNLDFNLVWRFHCTAWKECVLAVFLARIFPHLDWIRINNDVFRMLLTLFRMGFFGAAHGWGGRGAKRPPSLKPFTHILQLWNLAHLYLTQRTAKKYMNHATHSLSSADISIFSPRMSKFCYIKKFVIWLKLYYGCGHVTKVW